MHAPCPTADRCGLAGATGVSPASRLPPAQVGGPAGVVQSPVCPSRTGPSAWTLAEPLAGNAGPACTCYSQLSVCSVDGKLFRVFGAPWRDFGVCW